MLLTLLRHGIAQVRDGIIPDHQRQLTPKGIQRTQAALMGLARCCTGVDLILTSPKLRALQTAEMASEILDAPCHVAECLGQEELLPIVQCLEKQTVEHVMIVGHEPTFTELAEYLCSSDHADVSSPCMVLKKAGAMQLELSRNGTHLRRGASLLWLMQPNTLRMLGKSC